MVRRRAVVGVPQGLGDIFWVYQALYDYFDEIEFKIYLCSDCGTTRKVQHRSKNLVGYFPKVSNVYFDDSLNQAGYHNFVQEKWVVDEKIYDENVREVHTDLCFNLLLEQGKYLESICPVNYSINMPVKPCPVDDKYVILYVSGDTRHFDTVWEINKWVELIEYVDIPIYLIGAHFDEDILVELDKTIKGTGKNTKLIIGVNALNLFYLIKNCEYFIGYQSGLNVLADKEFPVVGKQSFQAI